MYMLYMYYKRTHSISVYSIYIVDHLKALRRMDCDVNYYLMSKEKIMYTQMCASAV